MVATPEIRATQAEVLAVYNIPAEAINVTYGGVNVAYNRTAQTMEVTQSLVLAIISGRTFDPTVRAWTFTLDGHDFYVLRCGNNETLVYDTYSKEWSVWGSETEDLWRAYNGANWLAGNTKASEYGSNIVVGDDSLGVLYFLDPNGDADDDPSEVDYPRTFERVIQGQLVHKGYSSVPCYGVQVQGSLTTPDAESATVTLSISDDRGNTYTDCGTITLAEDDNTTRLHWRSLGSVRVPGRLFKIVDYGALKRIDSLDMDDGE